jgi:hypothetical protein
MKESKNLRLKIASFLILPMLYTVTPLGGDFYMRTMICKQLGGICDEKFSAETFEEMAELSKRHGMEMFEKGDEEHLKVMEEMKGLMNKPEEMRKWMENKRKEFDALPEDK